MRDAHALSAGGDAAIRRAVPEVQYVLGHMDLSNPSTLSAAIDHYVQLKGLSLTAQQKSDLIEYLKTL